MGQNSPGWLSRKNGTCKLGPLDFNDLQVPLDVEPKLELEPRVTKIEVALFAMQFQPSSTRFGTSKLSKMLRLLLQFRNSGRQ